MAKRLKGRSSKLIRDRFPQLKEWCPGHLWAPSCYHGSVGQGWDVVERYISGQKGYCCEKEDERREMREGRGGRYSYEKADTVPVVVIDGEKENAHKTWYNTLYNKLFGGKPQK
ncbi:MAG: transposase [Proteobacteria bacterium]|nr:transposase [Pseudomonadota bacterium]